MTVPNAVRNLHQLAAGTAMRRVFIRDLVLPALIGIHHHEQDGHQRVRINLDMAVPEPGHPIQDRLPDVVCYEEIVTKVRKIVSEGHINLVETLAERIADEVLSDTRIASITIRVEKLDVFSDASSVGIEIERPIVVNS
jgi:dihydroneopterin aldolase